MKKVVFFLTLVVIAGILLTGCGTPASQEKQKTVEQQEVIKQATKEKQTRKEEKEITEPETYEEWLKQAIEKVAGKKSNLNKPRIESILFLDEKQSIMEICLWADENLTSSMIRDELLLKSALILEEIFADSRASEVTLYWLYPVTNTSGQETELTLAQIIMSRETAQEINWDNFKPFDLLTVADKCNIHPELQ